MAALIGGVVNLPELHDIRLAALINKMMGGAVVAAWDIKHLPIEWLLTFTWMISDYADAAQIAKDQEQRLEEIKAKHSQ